jgi:hypothetical protein
VGSAVCLESVEGVKGGDSSYTVTGGVLTEVERIRYKSLLLFRSVVLGTRHVEGESGADIYMHVRLQASQCMTLLREWAL